MDSKKRLSTIGFAYFLLAGLANGIAILVSLLLKEYSPKVLQYSIMTWVLGVGPIYLIGMPVCAKVMRGVSKRRLYRNPMPKNRWFDLICICFFLMFFGNIIGNIVATILNRLTPFHLTFDIQDIMMNQNLGMILLFTVIIAPILEELFFRKILIDRAIVFGDKTAILLSGVLFALFHGNFFQVFYAFFLGCLFAYVYIRTGNIRNSIILHMVVNFFGGFVSTAFMRAIGFDQIISGFGQNQLGGVNLVFNHLGMVLLFTLYYIVLIILGIRGLIRLIPLLRGLYLNPGENSAPTRIMIGNIFGNIGIWLFIAVSVAIFIYNMI